MLNKIKEILDSVSDYTLITIAVSLVLFFGFYYTHKEKPKVPVVTVPNEITTEIVQEEIAKKKPDLAYAAPEVVEEIRKTKTPIAVNVPEKDVQKEVDKTKGDFALQEGKNIYSIKVKKAEHGIGMYVGANTGRSVRDSATLGLHYRNKRWIYQVGVDRELRPDIRIAYEVIQW